MTASLKDPQIRFDKVTREFDNGFKSLDDVSFEIFPGEFVFFVGNSGAGKTSLIKLLIREDKPTSGTIYFAGSDISQIPQNEIHTLRRKIGVVFQDFKVLYSRTVYDNVAIALEVSDSSKNETYEIVPNVLSLVGLKNKAEAMPSTLSGGELQRLSIARALAHEPDVLVADEPTGNVDPTATDHIMNIFETVNSLGTTVLMATHDDRIVSKLKKRVIKLDNGKFVSDTKEGKYDG